jgi:hypothetical protein
MEAYAAFALLALSVNLLLNGVRVSAANIGRVSAFLFSVTYIMYETIVGTGSGSSYGVPPRWPPLSRKRSSTPSFETSRTL